MVHSVGLAVNFLYCSNARFCTTRRIKWSVGRGNCALLFVGSTDDPVGISGGKAALKPGTGFAHYAKMDNECMNGKVFLLYDNADILLV